jgi:hypothetical protein
MPSANVSLDAFGRMGNGVFCCGKRVDAQVDDLLQGLAPHLFLFAQFLVHVF